MLDAVSPLLPPGAALGAYRILQSEQQTRFSQQYAAFDTTKNANCSLLFLHGAFGRVAGRDASFADQWQNIARRLIVLQHPNILPILDLGVYQQTPFLVYPTIQTRTLRERLGQSGPIDPLTAGRYIDQIAGALEYAHEHGLVHGTLNIDTCLIHRDGHLIVANFGVMPLYQLMNPQGFHALIQQTRLDVAPEMAMGQPIGAAADVYALGAMLFQALTGTAIPGQRTPSQRLDMAISTVRPQLPPQLNEVFSAALAPDPLQRFARPGAFANAYHHVVAPVNPSRIPFSIKPFLANPTLDEAVSPPRYGSSTSAHAFSPPSSPLLEEVAHLHAGRMQPPPPPMQIPSEYQYPSDRIALSRQPTRFRRGRLLLIAGAMLAILLLATAIIRQRSTTTVQAAASVVLRDDTNSHVSVLSLVANHLPAPAPGKQYIAWLIEVQSETILSLGQLKADGSANQTYSLTFPGSGKNVLSEGNQFLVTQEEPGSTAPVGKRILTGIYPALPLVHLKHLLVAFPATPANVGLLTGLVDQTRLLQSTAHQLGIAVATGNQTAVRCLTGAIISLIEGAKGPHAAAQPACAAQSGLTLGDGYGLYVIGSSPPTGYVPNASAHATLAATQTDATNAMHGHINELIASLSNIQRLLTTIDADAVSFPTAPDQATTASEIVNLADQAFAGGINADGTASTATPPTSAGAQYAYAAGLAMAELILAPPLSLTP